MSLVTRALVPNVARPALSQSAMATLVADLAADPRCWPPIVRDRSDRSWWYLLHEERDVDVWLLSRLRDQVTDLHDHGDSREHFRVVAGQLTEVRASRAGALTRTLLSAGQSRSVPVRAVHEVFNDHAEPAISLHAYSPPLARGTFYEREAGRLHVTGHQWAPAEHGRTADRGLDGGRGACQAS